MIKTLYARLVLALVPLAMPSLVSASLADFPVPFAQSTLENTVEIQSTGHLVLFSPVREVNDEIRSESLARLPVEGEGRLYQLSRDASRESARDHYQRVLNERNAQVLFDCAGIRCGRSNVWANQIFGQRTLLGRDDTQDYLVAGSIAEDGARWLTLVYTVTRGNLREYVWAEHLRVGAGATIPSLGTVDERVKGPIIVPWRGGVTYRFDWRGSDRRRLSDLASQEGAVVVLVGYSELETDESFSEARERARMAAESLSEVLTKTGVPRNQQTIIVPGPAGVFKDPDRQGNRVELIVVSG